MTDAYGIPANMFGPVPEEFYALIGRVVMVYAKLEDALLGLLTQLAQAPQSKYAGESASDLIKRARRQLDRYEDEFKLSANAQLDRVTEALDRRNAVVHSLYPSPTMESAYRWRAVRKNKRPSPGNPFTDETTSETEMHDLIVLGVDLVHYLDGLRQRAAHYPYMEPPGTTPD